MLKLKLIIKSFVLVILSIVLEVTIAPLFSVTFLDSLGLQIRGISSFAILFILPSLASVVIIIGVVGGIWINGSKWLGFKLSLVVSIIDFIGFAIARGLKFDIPTFISIASIFIIALSGGFAYRCIGSATYCRCSGSAIF